MIQASSMSKVSIPAMSKQDVYPGGSKGKVTVIGLSRLEPMRLPPFTRVEPHQNQSLQAHDSPSNPHRTNEPAAAPLEACLMSIRDCSLRGSSTSTASLGRLFPSIEFQVSKDFFCSHSIFLHWSYFLHEYLWSAHLSLRGASIQLMISLAVLATCRGRTRR